MGEIDSSSSLTMPIVLVIGAYDSIQFCRTRIHLELVENFPGNISIREERRDDLLGLYWYLPSSYNTLNDSDVRNRLTSIRDKLNEYKLDVLFLNQLLDTKEDSLFVFDMDSTLIQEEVIDELARMNGVYDEVARVTQEAMEGGLGFEEALRRRVNYLVGLPESSFDELYLQLHPNPGVGELLSGLKNEYRSKRAVLSGGFFPILQKFSDEYELDCVEANLLVVESGYLTGELTGVIVGKERKKEALLQLRDRWNINSSQVVAVGDGANDLAMIQAAGIGLGFHAKEGLKKDILNWIDHSPMTALFLLFTPSL